MALVPPRQRSTAVQTLFYQRLCARHHTVTTCCSAARPPALLHTQAPSVSPPASTQPHQRDFQSRGGAARPPVAAITTGLHRSATSASTPVPHTGHTRNTISRGRSTPPYAPIRRTLHNSLPHAAPLFSHRAVPWSRTTTSPSSVTRPLICVSVVYVFYAV